MALAQDLSEFVESLKSNGVEFVVVGAYAVAFHGLPRLTGDIDFLIRPSVENVGALRRALDDFGFASVVFDQAELAEPGKMLTLGNPPRRIDIMTSISGLDFDEAWSSRVDGPINGSTVHYIGYDALIANKTASGRTKDMRDVEELNAIHNS